MSDKMMRRTLIVCAGVLVLCGLPMVVMAVVQRDVRMGLYGVMSLLFALSDVLQLFLVGGCWAAPSGHDVRFEDAAGRWVYEGQLRADTVRHGVIPDRSNHQERHEILRVESFDGDVKAVQSFLNEHDAGYIAEVTPEQPIIVEALGNKACVYVTKIVQCELRDVLRLLAAKWRKIGLTVEQVSVQDVRYGEAITKKYTEAQAAEIDKQKALNEQQVAKTEAETKKIKAQGEADANAVLNESLTDNVLKQHYIDALSNADQLVVVPDGADTLVQTK